MPIRKFIIIFFFVFGFLLWQISGRLSPADFENNKVYAQSDPSNRGFIRIDSNNPHSFVFDNGERYFPMGDTSYYLLESDMGTIKSYLDSRAQAGFNFIRIMAHSTTGLGRLDEVFDEAAARGINIELILWGYGDAPSGGGVDIWGDSTAEEAWAETLATRYRNRTNLLMYTVANEFERYPSRYNYDYSPSDVDWAKHISDVIEANDPNHPVGVHPSAWTQYYNEGFYYNGFTTRAPQVVWPLWEDGSVDLFIHQNNSGVHINHGGSYLTYDPINWQGVNYPVTWTSSGWDFPYGAAGLDDSVAEDWDHGKPVVNTEFGYQYESGCPGTPLCNSQQAHSADSTRRKAWQIAAAGGYFAAGFSSTWREPDDYGNWSPEYLSILYDFFTTRTEYWKMAPHLELVDPENVALALPGVEYVAYFPRGGMNTLQLETGTYSIEWLNPRSGIYYQQGSLVLNGRENFTPPNDANEDWVLHLMRSGLATVVPSATPRPTGIISSTPKPTVSPIPPGGKLALTFVSGSQDYSGEDWSNAIDGDVSGWDGTVTFKGSSAYGMFSLPSLTSVDKVRLLTDTGVGYDFRWIRDFRIQISTTGVSDTDFSTVFSGTKAIGGWETFVFPSTQARYLKLIIDNPPGRDGWHQLGEFEVDGSAGSSDLDNDGDVDIYDYSILVRGFGFKGCGNKADIDGDCDVDIFDYSILVRNFGMRKPSPTPTSFATPTLKPSVSPLPSPPINFRQGHTYPRFASFNWCCDPVEHYAKFDVVINRDTDAAKIVRARELNPNVLWLHTQDFNTFASRNELPAQYLPSWPDEWAVVDSSGNKLSMGGWYGGDYIPDLSDLGVRVNGERFIDFAPELMARIVADTGADGAASDGLYYRGHYSWYGWDDVDFDRNGVNDMVEHGKDWAVSRWAAGVDIFLGRLRQLLGQDKLIVINTGSGDIASPPAINGPLLEYHTVDFDSGGSSYFRDNFARVYQPPVFVVSIRADDPGRDPQSPSKSYDNFAFFRWGLAYSMLHGAYFQPEAYESGEHYWTEEMDEMELDVGYPKGDKKEIAPGVWARIFDRGTAIANFNDRSVTVTDSQLSSAPGYAGGYWRFEGCQDPAMNNGGEFSSVTLQGHSYLGYGDATYLVGDGIVLVDMPTRACPTIMKPPGGYWRE